MTRIFLEFVYLQSMDLLTTIAFIVTGTAEANPFVKWLMTSYGGIEGLLIAKGIAVALAFICVARSSLRLLNGINVFFALLVTYNVCVIIVENL